MKKILIANRGEIAVRIIRAAQEMNISTVAVYSEPDRAALHVKMADEAYLIGPGPAKDSYLKIEAIIRVCQESGADAIHPGYGFLSENAEFAKRVQEAGIIFIGPDFQTMELMGDKLRAKELAQKLGVPLVPGSDGPVKNADEAKIVSGNIGFPILIKASAGGGGKGMRIVYHESDFEDSLETAIREAESAFGDGSIFLEKYIDSPKHIEIQVLADSFGNTVHLFERECSVQRRHQKVIEEAPSSLLQEDMRQKMGKCAVLLTKACGYKSAGTIEFIVDSNQNFYFLEMNTRLQVEHPVTELITGIDLVKEQIRIADGKHLSFSQDDLKIRGHAIELRIYAEDPFNNFLPDTGVLSLYTLPSGPGLRVDNGVEQGSEVSIYYDPMLAKLVSYGNNREEAIQRMIRAIKEYSIRGVKNTLAFGDYVMNHPQFQNGSFDTHFVKNHFFPFLENSSASQKDIINALDEDCEARRELAIYFAVNEFIKSNSNTSMTLSPKPNHQENWKRRRTEN